MMANILIVDDQQCVRELLSEELMCEGYGVEKIADVLNRKTGREMKKETQSLHRISKSFEVCFEE